MGREIGIDLGTTNSAVAGVKDGKIVMAENKEGGILTPSVVHFARDGLVVGERALQMLIVFCAYCAWEVKRLMGDDVAAFVHPDTGREYSPVEISSFILKYLKESAETFFGEPVESAVISVPAYFKSAARDATRQAAEMAGLKVLKILNEPTAALRIYAHTHPGMQGKYAVLDLGGGTMDMSIAELGGPEDRILFSDGDRRLGGTDFSMAIERLILEEFRQKGAEFDPADPGDAACLQDIREKAERAKRETSSLESATIALMARGVQAVLELTRERFEELTREYVDRIRDKCLSAIQQSVGDVSELRGIVLVGGATRMPCIQRMVEELSGGKVPILKDVSVDTAVAQGCAIEAYELSGKPTQFLPIRKMRDVTSFDIGVAAYKSVEGEADQLYVGCILPKGTPIPARASKDFGLASMPGASGQAAQIIVSEGKEGQLHREDMTIQVFALEGLEPGADPNRPRIRVEIAVDASGIAAAEATDLETGKQVRQQIERRATQ